MPQNGSIQDIWDLMPDAEMRARTQKLIAFSVELLSMSAADTFLGRKTQEPFPIEEEE